MRCSNAPFTEYGQSEIIRDVEYLYMLISDGTNDLNDAAPLNADQTVGDSGVTPTSAASGGLSQSDADLRYLRIVNNLSDIASAATTRTNLGLGSIATHNATEFLQSSLNLSDLTNSEVARTNIGIGNFNYAGLTQSYQIENGGTARGTGAIDFQNHRTFSGNAAHCATGVRAFCCGDDNLVSGTDSFILGGFLNTVSGSYSCAGGGQNTVSGDGSVAFGGSNTITGGSYSFGLGNGNVITLASGIVCGALGLSNTITLPGTSGTAYAFGYSNAITAPFAVALGGGNTVSGSGGIALGNGNICSGTNSGSANGALAIGTNCQAGDLSTAIGIGSRANGSHAIAIAGGTATGFNATAIGNGTNASNQYAFAIGSFVAAPDFQSMIIGSGAFTTSGSNTLTIAYTGGVYALGDYHINGLRILTVRQGAIPAPTGGGTIDAEGRTAINAIRSILQTHGLTA